MNILTVTAQAPGAWPNGATVIKRNSQPDDRTKDGERGKITGSVDVRQMNKTASFAYFVHWTDFPVPILCVDTNNDGTPRLELERPN